MVVQVPMYGKCTKWYILKLSILNWLESFVFGERR